MTDHQRGDTALGEHPCITPNLTQLAAEGVTFAETYCPSPHCCPARASFMTGLYPTRHGVWNNVGNAQALSRGLKDGVRTWSEDLAEAGYNLAWSGKWHVSVEEGPADRGWEVLAGGAAKGNVAGDPWESYARYADEPEPTQRGEGQILRPGYGTYTAYGERDAGNVHDERCVQLAVEKLPELSAAGKPWALYVGCGGPHDPYFVPRQYLDMYALDDVPLPPSYSDTLDDKPRIYKRMHQMRWGQLSEREVREAIRHFWAYCTYLDDLFGRVLAALKATGQAHQTLVLYTSDHADYCGDHGLFAKGIPCFRGAYHVPSIIRWPAGVADPGRRVSEFVSLADFHPTFTEAATGRCDAELTGRSLMPLLRNEEPQNWRDEIHTQCNGVELYYTQRSVTTKDYKYVFNGFDNDELYDLRSDPHEMRNIAADTDSSETIREMCRRMWRFAHREQDTAVNKYITVALAPYGPAEAFRD
jgi:arylsulfatase A-like enzyme